MHHISPKDVYLPVFHCSTKKNSTMINFYSGFIQLPFLHSSKRQFPSCLLPLCKKKSKCETIHMTSTYRFKLSFHKDSFWYWGTKKHSYMIWLTGAFDLLLNCNKHDKVQLFAKFKKILRNRFLIMLGRVSTWMPISVISLCFSLLLWLSSFIASHDKGELTKQEKAKQTWWMIFCLFCFHFSIQYEKDYRNGVLNLWVWILTKTTD